MIFLHDNTLLKRELVFNDIKPRLLGEFNPHLLPPVIIFTHVSKATGEHVPVSSWSIPT